MTRPRKSTPAIAGPPPRKREGPGGFLLSAFIHAAIVLLLITSPLSHGFTATPVEGAGGPGPAGGGGGRTGSGFDGERVRFVQTRPAAALPSPAPALVPSPPLTKPVVPAVVTPAATAPVAQAPASGTGTAGTGIAGAGGSGTGTGGGTGSGIGTGRGSGVGPGTGGGDGLTHPPTPTQVFLPPLPAPARIKPYHLIAWFDVDERGNAKLLSFNPSRDGGYNRRLRDVLLSLKFRPGVTADGVPVRDTIDIQFVF